MPNAPRIQSDFVPAGSLRLAQVIYISSRQETIGEKRLLDILIACGVEEASIRDGSIVMARIYCCGGSNEVETARMLYAPPEIRVDLGDVVEVLVGHPANGADPGRLNTVTRIRQKRADPDGACRWDPPDEGKWTRVLYADWMPQEGWIRESGPIFPAWYKPPSGS